ncbi:Aspartic proteinase nepenthesin-1 [Bienertia sinuspersici]
MLTKINSISLPLIPIDSPKLQILPDSLSTQRQLRLQFLKNISMARAASYTPRDSNTSINSIQSLVQKVLSGFYVTQVFFGSSSYLMSPYLLVDTGDTNTWVQVEGCNPCFEVKNGNIRPQASPTFALLSLDDPRCNPKLAYHWSCGYKSFYGSASSGGEMGTELFHFINAETQEPESYPCVAFGLGYQNQFFDFGLNTGPNNLISGVFGLSPGPRSLINQLDETIKGRFSYCLTDWDEQNPGMSTINFGDSARITAPDVIQMPMNARLRYHLFFRGMSVDGTRVPFHSSNCALQDRPVTGGLWKGFFIDSGSPYSVLPPAAYQPLRAAMISYFARYGLQPLAPGAGPFDLCYSKGLQEAKLFRQWFFILLDLESEQGKLIGL